MIVGFAGGKIENIKMNRVLLKNVSLVGLHWGMYSKEEPQQVEVVWRALSEMTESGKFKSTVFTDQEFNGLDSVPSALNALKTRGTWGKVVIRIPQRSSYQANI